MGNFSFLTDAALGGCQTTHIWRLNAAERVVQVAKPSKALGGQHE